MLLGWDKQRIATLQILYYIPDYRNLLQEFLWQFEDITPDFPRAHKFLLHWKNNVHATIHTVTLAHTDPFGRTRYINCGYYKDLK
jgi:uncharacterized protein Usg